MFLGEVVCMGKNDDFDGFIDRFEFNPELIEFLRQMNELILPEVEFTEVIQQLPEDLTRKK